jgi:hypothetical protein
VIAAARRFLSPRGCSSDPPLTTQQTARVDGRRALAPLLTPFYSYSRLVVPSSATWSRSSPSPASGRWRRTSGLVGMQWERSCNAALTSTYGTDDKEVLSANPASPSWVAKQGCPMLSSENP